MNQFKKLAICFSLLAAFVCVKPAFAVTATIDTDKILLEYTKAKEAAAQFKTQEDSLKAMLLEAQKKIKETSSPVEKKNLETSYDKKLKAQAEQIKTAQIKKLKEIESDIFAAIEKVNNGKYDLILKKSATVYCKNDITDAVLQRLNK